MKNKQPYLFCLVVLIPLIPTAIVYSLAVKSTAQVQSEVQKAAINLGGPVAVYVILLLVCFHMFQSMARDQVEPLNRLVEELGQEIAARALQALGAKHEVGKAFEGHWSFESFDEAFAAGKKPVSRGTAVINYDDAHNLTISGEYRDPSNDASLGAWKGTIIECNSTSIAYYFSVPQAAGSHETTGVTKLSSIFTDTNTNLIERMMGVWGALGQQGGGTIKMNRIRPGLD